MQTLVLRDVRLAYIRSGIISNRWPEYATYGPRLNADQLTARGFHFAAAALRGHDVSMMYMAGKL